MLEIGDIRITTSGVTGIVEAAERGQDPLRGMRERAGKEFEPTRKKSLVVSF